MSESNTSPHWLHNQDGLNGTRQALKSLVVLDEEKLTLSDQLALWRDGFDVPLAHVKPSAWEQSRRIRAAMGYTDAR